MIEFITGAVFGSVVALAAVFAVRAMPHKPKAEEPVKDSLNAQKREREAWLKEQERQHENMMNYNGKAQV